jgi:type II secretory pathway component PulK
MKAIFRQRTSTLRRGVTVFGAVAALTLVSVLMATVGAHLVSNRRQEAQHQREAQAVWLARAGVELAIDKLLTEGEKYRGEKLELIPKSQVVITVQAEEGAKDVFRVKSAARYPLDQPRPVLTSVERKVKRKVEEGAARVEGVP